MLLKLLVPALAVGLLAGCVTDYNYRDGSRGDYYYGRPSTEYRYHDPYYGPYGPYSPYGYRRPYAYPYHYGPYRYYDGPYHYPRQYPRTRPRQPDNDRPPPWRDAERLRQAARPSGPALMPAPQQQRPMAPPRSQPRQEPRRRGSPLQQLIESRTQGD